MKIQKIIILISILTLSIALSAQKQLPSSTVLDINGQELDLKEYVADGKPKIVSFWATWCGPCRMELNALKNAYPKWKEKYGLEIVAVSVDIPQMASRAKKMFADNGWEYTFLHDNNQELMSKLGQSSIPYSVLVDGEGNIKSVQRGFSHSYESKIDRELKTFE